MEILVVVAIIILISSMAMPTVSSYFQLSLNSATRGIATTVKESYNAAVISGKVHRLVYDLKAKSYWVEAGPTTVLMHTKESREKAEQRKKFAKASDEPTPSGFVLEKSITRKKVSLPRGVEFEDIFTQQSPDPISDGTAYTHFFPHGITEKTLIHLKDQAKHRATLSISALLGTTDVYDRYVSSKELLEK